MKIFKPGTEVLIKSLGITDLKARVKIVEIGEEGVIRYYLKYWDGLAIKESYFYKDEVNSGSVQHTIGFHDANK